MSLLSSAKGMQYGSCGLTLVVEISKYLVLSLITNYVIFGYHGYATTLFNLLMTVAYNLTLTLTKSMVYSH